MTEAPPQFFHKVSRIWSSRKAREIYVLVEYGHWQEGRCHMYCLQRVLELG